jgi:hypothetical protein
VLTSLDKEATDRTCAEAHGLLHFMRKFEFIATLHMMSDILPPLAQLSRAFQAQNIDFSLVQPLVLATKTTLETLKDHPGEYFGSLSDVFVQLENCGVSIPSTEQMDRYHDGIYKKYLSTLLQHLDDRFPDIEIISAFSIFDPKTIPDNPQNRQGYGREELRIFQQKFATHGVVDEDGLKVEYPLFTNAVKVDQSLSKMTTRELMLYLSTNKTFQSMFPNLAKLSTIGLLLPMSTADCERGFSTLQRVKTETRNRLGNSTLNYLLAMSIEGPQPADFPYDEACDLWASLRKRRITVTS